MTYRLETLATETLDTLEANLLHAVNLSRRAVWPAEKRAAEDAMERAYDYLRDARAHARTEREARIDGALRTLGIVPASFQPVERAELERMIREPEPGARVVCSNRLPSAEAPEPEPEFGAWLVLWNMPGCLPESDPIECRTWEEGRDALRAELETELRRAQESEDRAGEREARKALRYLDGARDGERVLQYVGRYAYELREGR